MDLRKYSPITWVFERAFRALTVLPPQCIMHRVLRNRADLDQAHVNSPELTAERSRRVEMFLVTYYALDVLAFASTFVPSAALHVGAAAWATLRIIDIVQASVNISLFDRLRGREDERVASQARLTTLAIVNYLELIVCFATIYATGLLGDLKGASTPWDALYFSALTQLTVSFGDVMPAAAIRVAAPVQALCGLLFLVLVFARVISALPAIKEVLRDEKRDA